MSNNDSLDDETKRILAKVKADAQSGTDDSIESKSEKKKTDVDWETNDENSPDDDW